MGEGGFGLSGGQAQRVALARAFLRDAPLVLLDEPTAHLDPAAADRITAAIRTQMTDRTVVLITHQPPRPEHASRLLTLENGRLTSPGDPLQAPDQRSGLAVTP
jgi:ATP-binding cassette subfamily C protein CydD